MLKDNELIAITGGAINATYLNALSRIVSTILGIGQIIGSAIKRIAQKSAC